MSPDYRCNVGGGAVSMGGLGAISISLSLGFLLFSMSISISISISEVGHATLHRPSGF